MTAISAQLSERELAEIVKNLARKAVGRNFAVKVGHELPYHVQIEPSGKFSKRAFQTDVCILQGEFPRVIIELKIGVHTHDIITYSSKAVMHKRVFPYVRYGLLFAKNPTIPAKVFWHNEGFDFCIAAAGMSRKQLGDVLAEVLRDEIEASCELERLGTRKSRIGVYRRSVDGIKRSK